MIEEQKDGEFFYECHKCKNLIPGYFQTNMLDPVIMVADTKPNTYVFECAKCNPEALS